MDDRHETEKAAPDRDIGDVGNPDVVRALDRQIAQEIGIDLVAVRRRVIRGRGRSPAWGWRSAQASVWRTHDDGQIPVNPYESVVGGRRDQAFPVLSEADISRVERFGERRQYRPGERLFAAGERTPGMFVVLKGALTMTARDGLGRTARVVRHRRGQFTGEVAQLSTGVAVVDADADDDVEALLIPPDRLHALIVAEAELGERIVRALILRRVAHVESGGSGPVLIGDLQSPEMLRLENFLRRNGQPHHAVDPSQDKAAALLLAQYGASAQDVLVACPNGSMLLTPSEDSLARCLGMVDTLERDECAVSSRLVFLAGFLTTGFMALEDLDIANGRGKIRACSRCPRCPNFHA